MLKVVDHFLFFNGRSSLEFGAVIDGNQTFSTAERAVERVTVPGRNGTLTIDSGRYEDITVPYSGYIVKDFQRNVLAFANHLTRDAAKHRLEDSIHPEFFRMGAFQGGLDPKVAFLEAGSFTLKFRCSPERWLKSGEDPVEVTGGTPVTVTNPTLFPAKPLIYVTVGTGAISIGSCTISLSANSGGTIIDCELEDAWEGAVNRNKDLTRSSGDFPVLPPGETTISVANGMTVSVIPRWWML